MLVGLNHITIAVSDLERSLHFYTQILGMKGHVKWDRGAYLSAGELWVCLSCDEPKPSQDYTHIAFDITADNFDAMTLRIQNSDVKLWKENSSEGSSLYLLDPDGHKLEVHVGDLQSRLDSLKQKPYKGLVWL